MPAVSASSRDFYPDYVTDTTSKRSRKVSQRTGGGGGLIPRLVSATGHESLVWVILRLGKDQDLYARATAEKARKAGKAVTGQNPCWNALQQGVNGGLHLNIIMAKAHVPPRRELPHGAHVQDVTDLLGLVHYLSGPPDARAGVQTDPVTRRKTRPTAAQLVAATAAYRAARARGRLPDMQWTSCLPRLKATLPMANNALRESSADCQPCPPGRPRLRQSGVQHRRAGGEGSTRPRAALAQRAAFGQPAPRPPGRAATRHHAGCDPGLGAARGPPGNV